MKEINELLSGNIINAGKLVLTGWDIIMVLLIFALTKLVLFFVRRWIARYNMRRNRHAWDGNTKAIFQLVRYFIWVLAIVFMLDVAHINLSFLLAGSAALLVGIGFGLQQIFQDIISGVFILIERKVKIGDVMEVDDFIGHITDIGLRTSTIVTRDGNSIIIPNHKFINDNVLNWSHADALMRFKITIGVAYGSDVNLVAALLKEAATEHPEIIEDSEHPNIVRLTDFADSALKFDLLFWTTRKFTVENLKSELRFAVLKKLNEHKVVIPFPQRDLHLKSGFPREI